MLYTDTRPTKEYLAGCVRILFGALGRPVQSVRAHESDADMTDLLARVATVPGVEFMSVTPEPDINKNHKPYIWDTCIDRWL